MHTKSSAAITLVFDKSETFILLIKRRDVPMWVLPGGGVDLNELPENAASREVLEESGLTVNTPQLLAEFTPINKLACHTYIYRATAKDGSLFSTNESCDAAFFRPQDFPANTFYVHRNWIEEVLHAKNVVQRPLHEITYMNFIKYLCRHPITSLRYLLSWFGFPINA